MPSTDVPPGMWRTLVGVWTAVGLGIVVYGLAHVFGEPLRFLLAPILLGSIIVYLLAPVVDGLGRWGVPRLVATFLTYILVAGMLVVAGWALVPLLSRQFAALMEGLPDILITVREAMSRTLGPLGLDGVLPSPADGQEMSDWVGSLVEGNGDQVVGLLGSLRALVGSLVSGVLGLVLAPVLAFYFLADLPRVIAGLQRLVPPDRREEVTDVGHRILTTVGAYFRGQLLVAAFVGVATAAGLAVVGLPFWAIIGAAAGLFNLVPFIGPTVGALLGVVVAMTVGDGPTQAVVVVVIMVVVQQLDNHAITPAILSHTVHVHPVTIIVALTFAASMFGLLGMLVAIPTVAAAKLVVLYLLTTRVPSMAHLSDPDQFLDGAPLPPARPGSLAGLSQQLRRAREQRRRHDGVGDQSG